ncbi:MAG: hypothetical protein OHK0011_15700 [Turneriella sp.]
MDVVIECEVSITITNTNSPLKVNTITPGGFSCNMGLLCPILPQKKPSTIRAPCKFLQPPPCSHITIIRPFFL